MQKKSTIFFLIGLMLWGCQKSEEELIVTGYAPIYRASNTEVRLTPSPTEITAAGKVVTKGDVIYVVEIGQGIHILRYIPGTAPSHIGFINSVGCSDLAIKGNRIYTNNLQDLVTIDISSTDQIKVLSRTKDVFQNQISDHPPATGYYFQCPRDNDSILVGWSLQLLQNPKCYYE